MSAGKQKLLPVAHGGGRLGDVPVFCLEGRALALGTSGKAKLSILEAGCRMTAGDGALDLIDAGCVVIQGPARWAVLIPQGKQLGPVR